MKKKYGLLILMLISLLFLPTSTKAWDQIGSGNGFSTGSSSKCTSAKGCCFCRWNNKNFSALQFTIVYYDGNTRHQLGAKKAYYRANNATWLTQRVKGAIKADWLPYTETLYKADYSQKLKNTLIGSAAKANNYKYIREIFKNAGVNYDAVLSAVKTKGPYGSFSSIINEKIGSKGAKTRGIRVVVEPIFVIESTGFCPSFREIMDKAYTAKNMVAFGLSKDSNGFRYLNNNTLEMFAQSFYLERGDAGYNAAGSLVLSAVPGATNGYGLNIYGPFDEDSPPGDDDPGVKCNPDVDGIRTCCERFGIKPTDKSKNTLDNLIRKLTDDEINTYCHNIGGGSKCDPDLTYKGYQTGVQYCCATVPISVENKKKNTEQYLTRVLTDYEIKSQCEKSALKCNPDIVGVDTCCEMFGITPTNQKNNTAGEGGNLTRKLTTDELLASKCNKDWDEGTCSYILDVKSPSVCETNTTGKAIDAATWECVFKSTNSKKENVKDHYIDTGIGSNRYCQVYCKETINYSLPGSGTEVHSGRYLVVGEVTTTMPSLSPVTYDGMKACRTTSSKGSKDGYINVPRFLSDMEKVDNEIRSYWDQWKIAEALQKACDTETGQSYNGSTYYCPIDEDGNKPNYTSTIISAKAGYENALNTREKVYLAQINKCSEYGIKYDFEPEVVLQYEEPIYGFGVTGAIKNFPLKKAEETITEKIYYYVGGNASSGSYGSVYSSIPYQDLLVYECSGNVACKKTKLVKYAKTTWWEKSIREVDKYVLPDGTYQYINKATGESFNSKVDAGGENSVHVSISNLPIHYSTDAGDINFRVTTKTFGPGSKMDKYALKNESFAGKKYNGTDTMNCTFKVKCDKHMITTDLKKYCEVCKEETDTCPKDWDEDPELPEKDLNLIFRTIALDKVEGSSGGELILAFTGIDGKGRTPGDNWNNPNIIESIINKNRGVEDYEVYKESPMYEITLTPSLMKTIREYNKKMNSKKYSIYGEIGIAGYSDYESMKCEGNGAKCASTKIREWGVKGCAIQEGFDGSKYNKCNTVDKWKVS